MGGIQGSVGLRAFGILQFLRFPTVLEYVQRPRVPDRALRLSPSRLRRIHKHSPRDFNRPDSDRGVRRPVFQRDAYRLMRLADNNLFYVFGVDYW